jgi:hypothetical protein
MPPRDSELLVWKMLSVAAAVVAVDTADAAAAGVAGMPADTIVGTVAVAVAGQTDDSGR